MGSCSSVELRARRRVPRGGAGGAAVPLPTVADEVTTAGLETPLPNDANPIAEEASQQHEEEEVAEEEVEVPIRVQRLRGVKLFETLDDPEIKAAADLLQEVQFEPGETIITRGDEGNDCFILDSGEAFATIPIENGTWIEVKQYEAGGFFGERALLRNEPRAASIITRTAATAFRLLRDDFVNIIRERDHKEDIVRNCKLFETMNDEQISKIAGALKRKVFHDGEYIITQGETGYHFFILEEGKCVASVRTGKTDQVVFTYAPGMLFGEVALLQEAKRGASIIATTECKILMLSREDFEKQLGPLSQLKAEQYVMDPRKSIADFFISGDHRGPQGVLKYYPEQERVSRLDTQTDWFVVYRPCSRDSIAKMLGRVGVGKGFNVKGKSAQKNRLSGFVPFLQISDNNHKAKVKDVPLHARTKIYYKSDEARESAYKLLNRALGGTVSRQITRPEVDILHDQYSEREKNKVFGLDVPTPLLRQVYIMQADISPMVGWETGRPSMPAFMNDNLAVCYAEKTDPPVVLMQWDQQDPMNPMGLLVSYAEEHVKPVLSDMDAFLVGSRGMEYESTPDEQVEIMKWELHHTRKLLEHPENRPNKGWIDAWLEVLASEKAKGFDAKIPEKGYGDPTSSKLTDLLIKETIECGAVRHGAEAFNFYMPQDMDPEFTVIWNGFEEEPPWRQMSETKLREFLIERVGDDYVFPMNPVWPVRNPQWWEVWEALKASEAAVDVLESWYPLWSDVRSTIEELHHKFPEGYQVAIPVESNQPGELDIIKSEENAVSSGFAVGEPIKTGYGAMTLVPSMDEFALEKDEIMALKAPLCVVDE